MTQASTRRALRAWLALAIVAGVLGVLRPWTIVPIRTTAARAFDADGYVAAIWSTRVREAAASSAVDLQTFVRRRSSTAAAGAEPARAAFVRGTATIADVDRTSRIGLARLRLPWAADGDAAAIQIGPVVRGTALRDALDFIRFTDFVNQLEFAGVANALNQRVLTDVLGPLNADDLAGREVTFIGAVPASSTAAIEIVPVELRIGGGAR